jgi:hypothetical protein
MTTTLNTVGRRKEEGSSHAARKVRFGGRALVVLAVGVTRAPETRVLAEGA